MEEHNNQTTQTSSSLFSQQRKKIVIFATAALVLAALPITLLLSRQPQDLRQQAAEETSPYCGSEITACVSSYTGQLRYTQNGVCTDGERELSWGDGNKQSPQIHTCVSRYTGAVRASYTAGTPLSCTSSETSLTWSQGDIDQPSIITGCVSLYTGQLRIPTSRGSCTTGERALAWATNTSEQCVEPTLTPTNTLIPTTRPTNTPIPTTRPSSTPTSTPRATNTPTPASVCNQQCFSDEDCAGGGTACGTCRAVNGSFEKICTTPIGGQPTPTNTPIPTATPTSVPATFTPTPSPFDPTITPTPTPIQPTNTPTSTPTQAPPTPTPTTIPSITPQPSEGVIILSLIMPGIGNQVGDNNSPLHNPRTADVEVFDLNNNSVSENALSVQYQNGIFSGSVSLDLPEGNYYAKARLNNTLKTQIQGVFELKHNSSTQLPTTTLIPGDLNADNILTIVDYNIFYDCIKDNSCTQEHKTLSDFNDDGSIGPVDYNILLRSFAIRAGS